MKIITIAFNGYGKYIPQLIKSVEKQTVKPDEVIIVLGKDHQMPEIETEVPLKIINTELDCLGTMINNGMDFVDDWVLCFNADDRLLPNAIEEIQKTEADVVTLKYKWDGSEFYPKGIYGTPKIEMEKVKEWKKHYLGPSGFLAFKKQEVVNSDFWQWPLLWKSKVTGKTIKETNNACAEWIMRPDSHGSGKNVGRAIEFLDEQAKRFTQKQKLSVFSVVYNEESMCREAWESVKEADELVICIDDRTTDKTPEIAKDFTDKIYYFKWEDDFAKAKNFAMSKCTGDWVFGIDGDCIIKGMDKIRKAIVETEHDTIDMTLYPIGRPWMKHYLPKVFKNGKIKYEGMAHEHPKGGTRDFKDYGIELEYDYSPNHFKDPDRYIRILTKATAKEPENPRWKYYLAREYYDKKNYQKSEEIFNEYIKMTKYLAEKADAYLYLAKIHWTEGDGNRSREMTMKAIEINPNFKEALLFMSQIVWPRHSQRWVDFAEKADNSEVLFIRV